MTKKNRGNLTRRDFNYKTWQIALAGLLIASGVLLSAISIPFGPTRCFPFQHSVNVISGILLGPWWGGGIAAVISVIRVSMGTGTIFAFPGSIPGAVAVGLAYRMTNKDWAAFAEPIGTGPAGATLSALLLGPAVGQTAGLWVLWGAFLVSSIPGAIIGFLAILFLRKSRFAKEKGS